MRINKYLAYRYGCSRRQADQAVSNGEVFVNSTPAMIGQEVTAATDIVLWTGHKQIERTHLSVALHKPVGYVSSRDGQGSPSLYDLLPERFRALKIAGRLDKDSSGLVVLSDDGDYIQRMTHPSFNKIKTYQVKLHKQLTDLDKKELLLGVDIGDDRPSRVSITKDMGDNKYELTLEEGRNRQIRRTFSALGYEVIELHRIAIEDIKLGDLTETDYRILQ